MTTQRSVRTRILRHAAWVVAVTLVVVLGASVSTVSRDVTGDKPPKQVKFSHGFHVNEAGVACTDCHGTAATSTQSSDNLLATMDACQSCHEDQLKNNCTYCHLSSDSTTYAASPNPRRELRFSHQAHVDGQKVACETCHTDLDRPTTTVGEIVPSMATCSTCHNDVKASNACETCHTNLAALRPAEHNRTDFVREHKILARQSDAACATCHTQESCAECHNGADLTAVNVPGRDLVSPHSPRLTAIDRGQGMNLMKVHDLNYRYTHAIDAKGKVTECKTCHSEETFCSTCHMAGGNVNQAAFKPSSHQQPGFIVLSVGSGGGTHAQLAKRDIESCASCHAEDGADPTCTRCHTDADGIRGTDPRTHEPGFMSDVHGPWHSDPGAVCYTCHNDPNAHVGGTKGRGFCGYCHR